MLYKTIKARRFYQYLFDLDKGDTYRMINHRSCRKCGYFLIKSFDGETWKMLKQARSKELGAEEHLNVLPLFVKIKLNSFLHQNFGSYKSVQKILDSLTF